MHVEHIACMTDFYSTPPPNPLSPFLPPSLSAVLFVMYKEGLFELPSLQLGEKPCQGYTQQTRRVKNSVKVHNRSNSVTSLTTC